MENSAANNSNGNCSSKMHPGERFGVPLCIMLAAMFLAPVSRGSDAGLAVMAFMMVVLPAVMVVTIPLTVFARRTVVGDIALMINLFIVTFGAAMALFSGR